MRQIPRRLGQGLLLLLLCSITPSSHGQDSPAARPLFAEHAPLHLTIEGPFRTLSINRRDREELDGLVRYQDTAGNSVTLDVRIRTRGNSRMELCTFPPLRLNFRRRQVEGTPFAGQSRLKLVTLCKDIASYRESLALEYEVYRIFNLLTNVSFRVRWVDVEYIDTDARRNSTQTRPAFLIEQGSEVAERNGMETWRIDTLDVGAHNSSATALVSLFQYMIGNTDWSGTNAAPGERCCHNGDVLRDSNGLAVILPYDFDQAGFVNAEYASPAAELPIRSVQQRLYRGYCAHNETLGSAFDRFRAARADIISLLEAADVRDRARRRILRYVENFYEVIDNDEERAESILAACRS